MMRILLVEDDENKRRNIGEFLHETYPASATVAAGSLHSGLRFLRRETLDVIILDMTLPTFDPGPDEPGGQPNLFGGRDFIRQMDRFDILLPVIVLTQFIAFGTGRYATDLDSLDQELFREYPQIYKGAIFYNSAISGWKDQLKEKLDEVVSRL